ncbi:MAG: AAA family ATPase [Solirubrobacteraceae bacterium]|nr:AAA family ATPase [Solirubrobacteraceae bacterium]
MSGIYDELIDALEAGRDLTARFRTAAFHVHSIDSYDWAKRPGADPERNAKERFETGSDAGLDEFLDELVGAGLEIVGVTDHMRSSYACRLAERANERGDITVFPGMEVNCLVEPHGTHRIHILVLFAPGTQPDQIERIFASQEDFPSERGRDGKAIEARITDFAAWAREVRQCGGIVIPAHVDDQERGIRSMFRHERGKSLEFFAEAAGAADGLSGEIVGEWRRYLAALDADAIELQRVGDQGFYARVTGDSDIPAMPCVMRADHHAVEEFSRAERATHVKLSAPTFENFRSALHFAPTRVRFADDLPASPNPTILGLRLSSTGAGLFKDLTAAFSPNLNCVIGPRGSGKSTVLEALRYVLGHNSELDAADGAGVAVSAADLAIGTQEANLKDTLIQVVYESPAHGVCVLEASFDSERVTTRVFDRNGTDLHIAADQLIDEFPARIYSWGEIETLGRRPDRQRALVDRLIEDAPRVRKKVLAGVSALELNRADVVDKARTLSGMLKPGASLTRFVEARANYERLNTVEVAQLFNDLDLCRQKLEIIDALDSDLIDLRDLLTKLDGEPTNARARTILSAIESAELNAWAQSFSQDLDIAALRTDVQEAALRLVGEVDTRRGTLMEAREVHEAERSAVEEALRSSTQGDSTEVVRREQREIARQRFQTAEGERKLYIEAYASLTKALDERRQLADNLQAAREELSMLRANSREELLERLGAVASELAVDIEVGPQDDRSAYAELIEDALLERSFAGNYRDQKVARRLCSGPLPGEFVRSVLDQAVPESLDDALAVEDYTRILAGLDVWTHHAGADVRAVDPDLLAKVLAVEEVSVDDAVRIKLDNRPVDELSPGQRAGAMVPLVALSEDSPLVIDQPEDNLDNRMVGVTLTRVLSELKERRQIVVATHNPNIVVGGDAEQVVVLEALSVRDAHLVRAACIDDTDIIEQVVGIMEGGKEAFDERNRRYAAAA